MGCFPLQWFSLINITLFFLFSLLPLSLPVSLCFLLLLFYRILLEFEGEISLTSSRIWTFGAQLTLLFGGGCELQKVQSAGGSSHWRQALRVHRSTVLRILWFFSAFAAEHVISQLPAPAIGWRTIPAIMDSLCGAISQNKLPHKLLLVMMFYGKTENS